MGKRVVEEVVDISAEVDRGGNDSEGGVLGREEDWGAGGRKVNS